MNDSGKILTLDEILKLELEEPSFLWEGLVAKGEINICVGPANAGKSPIILALIINIAYGKIFLGRKTQQGNILLIDEESSLNLLLFLI